MARQQANLEYNQFQSGLITEGNILNLPIDSFREGENFVLTKDNTLERRLGLGLENSGTLFDAYSPLSQSTNVNGVYVWNTHYSAVPEIIVIQTGDKLHFFDSQIEPLSDGKLLINSQEYIQTGGTSSDRISSTSVEGILVFTVFGNSPRTIQITSVDKSVASNRYDLTCEVNDLPLLTRDLWGRKPPVRERRTGTLSDDDRYDLTNQGWDITKWDLCYSATQTYPSDYDIWWLYKNTTGASVDRFNANLMRDTDTLGVGQKRQNMQAPRGSTISGMAQLASGSPTCLQAYAGRVFYAGFGETPRTVDDVRPDFSNHVFFTQLVKSNPDIAKCYQFSDPTSEEDSELVDTDGGFIKINAARRIVAMREVSSGLFIMAENGVWLVSGTDTGLFSATGYKVNKVCDFGCISESSIVVYDDAVMYLADDGIIVLSPDPTTGVHRAQNVTEQRIQSIYDDITPTAKLAAVGIVERSDKRVRWMFSEGANPTHFDLEIVLNLLTSSFFINRFKTDGNTPERVLGYIPERTTFTNTAPSDYFVVAGIDRVKANADDVTVGLTRREGDSVVKGVKQMVGNPSTDEVGFYQFNNEEFKDFGKVDAEAYLVSAPQKLDDTQRRKQVPNLATHMLRTDSFFLADDDSVTVANPSSMKLRIRWDYASSALSHKWTEAKECYRYRRPYNLNKGMNVYPYDVITARERVRGSGTAFQFEFRTEPEKDCKLLGWAVRVTGGTSV